MNIVEILKEAKEQGFKFAKDNADTWEIDNLIEEILQNEEDNKEYFLRDGYICESVNGFEGNKIYDLSK